MHPTAHIYARFRREGYRPDFGETEEAAIGSKKVMGQLSPLCKENGCKRSRHFDSACLHNVKNVVVKECYFFMAFQEPMRSTDTHPGGARKSIG